MKTTAKRPMTGRAKIMLRKIDKEINNIPKYKPAKTDHAGEVPFLAVNHGITAARRAVRYLKGAPLIGELANKRKKLQAYIDDAQEFRGMVFLEDGTSDKDKSMSTAIQKKRSTDDKKQHKSRGELGCEAILEAEKHT